MRNDNTQSQVNTQRRLYAFVWIFHLVHKITLIFEILSSNVVMYA